MIDRMFTNFSWSQKDAGTLSPLEVKPGCPDAEWHSSELTFHKCVCHSRKCGKINQIKSNQSVLFRVDFVRYFSEQSCEKFAGLDWVDQVSMNGSNKSQRKVLLVAAARRNYFHHIKAFRTGDRPKPFDVRTLYPGLSNKKVAEELARFFNKISHKFEAQVPADIPLTYVMHLPRLCTYQVAGCSRSRSLMSL